ncbi:MAG TPA: hypothetical protein VF836_08115, partial [Gemmatimonadaceae bacterium]
MARTLSTINARWIAALALAFVFLLLPGPARSAFSGMPLSSRGVAVFFALVIIVAFTCIYRPTRAVRARTLRALAVLCLLKLVLSQFVQLEGWRGEYWTSATWRRTTTVLKRATFMSSSGVRPFRI